MPDLADSEEKIWTVTELNRAAREALEEAFDRVWVEGEISNFKLYPSGHAYFSLKDEEGQLAAAMFRFASKNIRFDVVDGLAVLARGAPTIYDRRGQYQLIVEALEPKGKGALQLAFEQLKEKLRKEGLFDEERKRPLPALPRAVGVVTSPRGAAIRDIINVLRRRFANIEILINPVRVQGEGAAAEIAAAIAEFNLRGGVDVLIVGRGGGSIEDLWAFNEEAVARAIAASRIPVVSAVGHEVDYTIADFVADLRAPTPSAAAELVVQSRENLVAAVHRTSRDLAAAVSRSIRDGRRRIESLAVHRMIGDVRRLLRDSSQEADELGQRHRRALAEGVAARARMLAGFREALTHLSPRARQALLRERWHRTRAELKSAVLARLREGRERALRMAGTLDALSPLSVLSRGYSICRTHPALAVVKDAAAVSPGSEVSVRLHRGELLCRIERTRPRGDSGVDT